MFWARFSTRLSGKSCIFNGLRVLSKDTGFSLFPPSARDNPSAASVQQAGFFLLFCASVGYKVQKRQKFLIFSCSRPLFPI